MHYYFAPLEGLTDHIYREVHHRHFAGVDRYYMPFISPTMHHSLTHKENRELPMADSYPFEAVPQILTKVPEDFLWAAQRCMERGYGEVNLNIGCPSGTVVSKGKGSGMLADPDGLDRFLDRVFTSAEVAVSVKTRSGMASPEEFPRLLEIFNRYPIRELIIHPRTRKDFYRAPLCPEVFDYAMAHSKLRLCFNGDICTREELKKLEARYPALNRVMIGRGMIGDPGLLSPEPVTADILEAFHNILLDRYTEGFGSARNAMFRMKENWRYLACRFDGGEKLFKALRKTTDIHQFRSLTAQIFQTIPLRRELLPDWREQA